MTTTTDYGAEIDEILQNHLQDIRAGHDLKIKAKLLALLDQASTETRIDELQMTINMKGKVLFHGEILDSSMLPDNDNNKVAVEIIQARLSALTGRLTEKKGK